MRPVVGLLLGVLLAACAPPPGTLFRLTLVDPQGDYSLPIALGDQTGLVVGIEADAGDQPLDATESITADAKDPKVLILRWVGGACDNDATIAFYEGASNFALDLTTHGKLVLGCTALGVVRGIRITTTQPVAPGSISLTRR
jgi:hypothetical protein